MIVLSINTYGQHLQAGLLPHMLYQGPLLAGWGPKGNDKEHIHERSIILHYLQIITALQSLANLTHLFIQVLFSSISSNVSPLTTMPASLLTSSSSSSPKVLWLIIIISVSVDSILYNIQYYINTILVTSYPVLLAMLIAVSALSPVTIHTITPPSLR